MKTKTTNYIRAGYSGLYLLTPEEARAEAEIKRVAHDLGFSLHFWSIINGLVDTSTGAIHNALDPLEAENAFSLSVVGQGTVDPDLVAREKAQTLKKNGLLEIIATTAKPMSHLSRLIRPICSSAVWPHPSGPARASWVSHTVSVASAGRAFPQSFGHFAESTFADAKFGALFFTVVKSARRSFATVKTSGLRLSRKSLPPTRTRAKYIADGAWRNRLAMELFRQRYIFVAETRNFRPFRFANSGRLRYSKDTGLMDGVLE